jgi:hypothetical protein
MAGFFAFVIGALLFGLSLEAHTTWLQVLGYIAAAWFVIAAVIAWAQEFKNLN